MITIIQSMHSAPEIHSGSIHTSRGEKIARILVWAPLLAGALAVVASQRAVLWRWAHDLLDDSADAGKRSEKFARSIVGKPRSAIVKLIGSPSATARNSDGQEQWYYPVNRKERTALAITFNGDVVGSATLLRGISPSVRAVSKAIN